MFKSIPALALLFGIIHAPAALAETTGRAIAGPVTFTLIDLDPNDGITPSLVFDPMPYTVEPWVGPPRVGTSVSTNFDVTWDSTEGGGNTLPLTESSELPGFGWSKAEMLGRGEAGTHSMDVSAGVFEASGSEWQERHASASAMTGIFYFDITPNTEVTFHLPVDLVATRQSTFDARTSMDVGASLYMHMTGAREQWADTYISRMNSRSDFMLERQEIVSLTHANAGSSNQRGLLIVQATASIDSYTGVSPVPEPSGTAMLLAGMAVTGLWSLRRKYMSTQ